MNDTDRKYWVIKKIRKVLHEFLLKTDPEYRDKSPEEQERVVLIAVSDMMSTFNREKQS